MSETTAPTSNRYERAAPGWGDKMRTLGYFDAYLGFLSAQADADRTANSVIDIGSGTAAFAEAWVAINGKPAELTLLDPSQAMLDRGQRTLEKRGVDAKVTCAQLGQVETDPADVALAAHVLEHCPDPPQALRQMRNHLKPGGRLYLVVSKPHWCNAIIWFQWRHRTFGRDEILALVDDAGFDIERTYSFPSGPPSRTSRGIVATRQDA